MKPDTATLIGESWDELDTERFVDRFYARLLDADPTLVALFPADIAPIRRKFARMLSALIARRDDLEALSIELRGLGARHAGYGVEPEHYRLAGDTLLATLRSELGPRFDAATERAWTELYRSVADTMLSSDPPEV